MSAHRGNVFRKFFLLPSIEQQHSPQPRPGAPLRLPVRGRPAVEEGVSRAAADFWRELKTHRQSNKYFCHLKYELKNIFSETQEKDGLQESISQHRTKRVRGNRTNPVHTYVSFGYFLAKSNRIMSYCGSSHFFKKWSMNRDFVSLGPNSGLSAPDFGSSWAVPSPLVPSTTVNT